MRRIREAIVVEGRYDRNTLAQVVDATIVTLEGFSVFHDGEKLTLLRRLAEERGLIILTDSDGAGFVLRRFLKGAIPAGRVRQAYIPELRGKERRKRRPGREGLLGVEGMRPEVLLEALSRAGATFEERESQPARTPITKTDLYDWGLSGGPDSSEKRRALLEHLNLPKKMSANAMLEALNIFYSREELSAYLTEGKSGAWVGT